MLCVGSGVGVGCLGQDLLYAVASVVKELVIYLLCSPE